MQASAISLAEVYADVWAPFQSAFDEGLKEAPARFWSHNGIHTGMAGGELTARAWLEATR